MSKIITIDWECPKCESKEQTNWEGYNETPKSIESTIFHCYCSECEKEFPATTDNSTIRLHKQ